MAGDGNVARFSFYVQNTTTLEETEYNSTPSTCNIGINVCTNFSYIVGTTFESYSTFDEPGICSVSITDVDFKSGGVIKGAFSGTVVSPSTSETKTVTDGVFSAMIL